MNRIIHLISKILRLIILKINYGSGSTIPGHIALRINKNILHWYVKDLKEGVILITGTNGKTTTTHLIKEGLEGLGKKVVFSTTGANLENGIISSFINFLPFFAKKKYDYGVFEVDELNLKIITKNVEPLAIVFLNLSRDQLDRYAELEVIFNSWKESIKNLTNTKIYLYKNDKRLNNLTGKNISTFTNNFKSSSKLLGEFNNINLSASFSVLLDIFPNFKKDILKTLEDFNPVFGRGEKFIYNKNELTFLLNKNPASFNENLKLIIDLSPVYPQEINIVTIGLNNNIADGKDISWIYDVSTDLINILDKSISRWVCLGTRYIDIANRLKYAGIKEEKVVLINSYQGFKEYVETFENKRFWILPTYTSMLTMRSIFKDSRLGKSIKK